jgi:hypothetical protein|tara:strand:- start:36 stop:1133 length:1098 start_codon:yes stop_codon:yes gene_type:complete
MTLQIPFMPMESTEMDWGDREFSPRNCDWETYKALETHPIQRHEDLRIEDKTFKDKMSTPSPNHKVIWSARIATEFEHPTDASKTFKVGEEILADGHGRRAWWSLLANELTRPKNFLLLTVDVNSWEELIAAYSWFDSKYDVEKAKDRMYGAYRSVLRPKGISVTSEELLSPMPHEYAANLVWPDKFKRGAVSDHYSAVVLADQLKDAIIWLEGVLTNDNRGRKIALPNVILSPLLASYYKYCKDADKLAKVEEFIYKVTNDRTNHDPEDGKFNAVTLFLDGWKARKNDNPPDWLGGCILKANYQSEITEGFVLLHVDKYVKGECNKRQTHSDYCKDKRSYRDNWQESMREDEETAQSLEKVFNM